MAMEEENIMDKMNKGLIDLAEKISGEKGREFMENLQKQVRDFNATIAKSFVDFTDKVLEATKLDQNEMVQNASNNVKDLLKQADLLEEDLEEDF